MSLRTWVATWSAHLTQQLIYLTRKGKGETAPGLVGLTIDPTFIQRTNHAVPHRIVISGTNGKTTTTAIIKHLLKEKFPSLISNPTGSNLLRGIATSSLQITKQTPVVLWETDEAALVEIAEQVRPNFLLLTNLFRDQLDRYGEIDTIASNWEKLIDKLPQTTLILNADDPSLAYIGDKVSQHQILYYGLNYQSDHTRPDDCADAIFCPLCQKPLIYDFVTFSHLGSYSCSCGFQRPKLDYEVTNLHFIEQQAAFWINNQAYVLPLSGLYNVYNATAAIAVALQFSLSPANIATQLSQFIPAFGRQEVLKVKNKNIHLLLVKNPTGFNQVLDTLKQLPKPITVGILINDNTADGKDVSWLWDVNVSELNLIAKHILVGGDRAYDMGVRLKYAGFKTSEYSIQSDQNTFLKLVFSQKETDIYLLPTYTVMWQVREKLKAL